MRLCDVANLCWLDARRSELTIRAAVGASRWRLVRQLPAESPRIAAAGGMQGSSHGQSPDFDTDAARGNTIMEELTFDLRVPVFTALVSLVTTFVSGLWPQSRRRGPCGLIRSRRFATNSSTEVRSSRACYSSLRNRSAVRSRCDAAAVNAFLQCEAGARSYLATARFPA